MIELKGQLRATSLHDSGSDGEKLLLKIHLAFNLYVIFKVLYTFKFNI